MMWGFSPVLSVFWATVVSFVDQLPAAATRALIPYDLFRGRGLVLRASCGNRALVKALEGGSIGVLNVAATCAGAGIIVGVVTLTGLGLKFSSIVIDYAGGSLLLTAVYTSLVVWIVGLAVPVTASYIICAVIAAPALIKLGVPDFAAHMFIFYYAVLSEVSPPTALSPFAAAAITGGDPYKTTHAVLEVHRAGLPGAVHVRARPERPGAAADGLDQGAGAAPTGGRSPRSPSPPPSASPRWRRASRAGRSSAPRRSSG